MNKDQIQLASFANDYDRVRIRLDADLNRTCTSLLVIQGCTRNKAKAYRCMNKRIYSVLICLTSRNQSTIVSSFFMTSSENICILH